MFKIGDRVKVLPSITQQDGCDSQFLINKIGIIQFENQDDRGVNWYAVSFDTARYDAQHYAVEWRDKSSVDNLIKTMNFTHEEAKAETPVSACGVEIGESIVVRDIVLKGTTNLFKWITERKLSPLIISSPYKFDTVVM